MAASRRQPEITMSREAKRSPNATIPPTRGAPVTPSDVDMIEVTQGLFVGGEGDLTVEFADGPGVAVTLKGILAGQIIPGQFIKVLTATTASDIVALYN